MDKIDFKKIWDTLSKIDCKDHTEKKKTGKDKELTYLSWTWAWGICMKHFPEATYEIREWDGKPWLNDPVAGVMVMTHINIGGNIRAMWLACMDGANNALKEQPYSYFVKGYNGQAIEKKVAAVDMCAINKAIMRCLVKNLAMFGLGLNIYAGEDLPVGIEDEQPVEQPKPEKAPAKTPQKAAKPAQDASAKSGSATVSPKAHDAYKAFKALPQTMALGEADRTASWGLLIKTVTGKSRSIEIDDQAWDKVIARIETMREENMKSIEEVMR